MLQLLANLYGADEEDSLLTAQDTVAWMIGDSENADVLASLWYDELLQATAECKIRLFTLLRIILRNTHSPQARNLAEMFFLCLSDAVRHLSSVGSLDVNAAVEDALNEWGQACAGIVPIQKMDELEKIIAKNNSATTLKTYYPANPVTVYRANRNIIPILADFPEFPSFLEEYQAVLTRPDFPTDVQDPMLQVLRCLMDAKDGRDQDGVNMASRIIASNLCKIEDGDTVAICTGIHPQEVLATLDKVKSHNQNTIAQMERLLDQARGLELSIKSKMQAAHQQTLAHKQTLVLLRAVEDISDRRPLATYQYSQALARDKSNLSAYQLTQNVRTPKRKIPDVSEMCPNPLTHPHLFLRKRNSQPDLQACEAHAEQNVESDTEASDACPFEPKRVAASDDLFDSAPFWQPSDFELLQERNDEYFAVRSNVATCDTCTYQPKRVTSSDDKFDSVPFVQPSDFELIKERNDENFTARSNVAKCDTHRGKS